MTNATGLSQIVWQETELRAFLDRMGYTHLDPLGPSATPGGPPVGHTLNFYSGWPHRAQGLLRMVPRVAQDQEAQNQ